MCAKWSWSSSVVVKACETRWCCSGRSTRWQQEIRPTHSRFAFQSIVSQSVTDRKKWKGCSIAFIYLYPSICLFVCSFARQKERKVVKKVPSLLTNSKESVALCVFVFVNKPLLTTIKTTKMDINKSIIIILLTMIIAINTRITLGASVYQSKCNENKPVEKKNFNLFYYIYNIFF